MMEITDNEGLLSKFHNRDTNTLVKPNNEGELITSADMFLEALEEMDVEFIFANLGSDHPAIIDGLAKAKKNGKHVPRVIICPHEHEALAAAHGYAAVTGKAQAVIVHCDVGTQNLGGAVHNVSRGHIPVFIFAGETSFTLEGELPGTRNVFVNHIQNVTDQRGILRSYTKWDYEVRTGQNIKQLVYRGFQIANSEPKGPVYMSAAREVLAEAVDHKILHKENWKSIESSALPHWAVLEIVDHLVKAQNPLILTSYLGRNKEAVNSLIRLSEKLSIPVIEQNHHQYLNFPSSHPMHMGFHEGEFIAEADVILVLDNDSPWMHSNTKPNETCKIFYIDIDPLKEDFPVWYMPSSRFFKGDSKVILEQINEYLLTVAIEEKERIQQRWEKYAKIHQSMRKEWHKAEQQPKDNTISPTWLTACVREVIDEDTIVVDETITSQNIVSKHIPRNLPGTLIRSGGSSLGWNGGAAFGIKLAKPNKTVVNLTGDGCYMFSNPSAVHWMSRRYNAPFLTVIYNNQGWNATKINYELQYPGGVGVQEDTYWVNFQPTSDLAGIAKAAGGTYAQIVEKPSELVEALQKGIEQVRKGRSAVIDVRLPSISNQID